MDVKEPSELEELNAVRALWREYWDSLGLGDEFQGFADELARLPGHYDPILLATVDGEAAGAIALRPCAGECEVKRLYVRPAFRGRGIAAALLEAVIGEARARGYRTMFADTLPKLTAARALYRSRGFVETGPYSPEPTPGAICLKLDL